MSTNSALTIVLLFGIEMAPLLGARLAALLLLASRLAGLLALLASALLLATLLLVASGLPGLLALLAAALVVLATLLVAALILVLLVVHGRSSIDPADQQRAMDSTVPRAE
jgi:hypothetical protein